MEQQLIETGKTILEVLIVLGSIIIAYAYRVSAVEAQGIIKKVREATDPASIGGEKITPDEALDIVGDVIAALKKDEG